MDISAVNIKWSYTIFEHLGGNRMIGEIAYMIELYSNALLIAS